MHDRFQTVIHPMQLPVLRLKAARKGTDKLAREGRGGRRGFHCPTVTQPERPLREAPCLGRTQRRAESFYNKQPRLWILSFSEVLSYR